MSELMRQASRLQRKVAVRKDELKSATVEAGAGNDRVKVVVTGARELASISIDPQLLKEEDLGMVQDLIVAAVNAGMLKSTEMVEAEIEKVTGGVSIPGLM
jgi:DNA-binding YbaB/EbfC family protein